MRLAFSGKMCSGKTTLADLLLHHDPRFVKVSFADPIYALAREYFGMDEKDRDLLIHIGEAFRARDEQVWINAFLRNVAKLEAEGKSILVDDLRLPHEYKALAAAGFKLVRLNVSEQAQEDRLTKKYPGDAATHLAKRTHETECALDNVWDWDVFATRDAQVESVYQSVLALVDK